MLSSVVLDLRYALRSLSRRPGYAFLTIGVLAVAIAGNTTVFSALNAFLLRPLPYPDHDRIVMVYNSFPKLDFATGGSSIPDYLDRRSQAPSLESLAILTPVSRALSGEGPAEQLSGVRASPSLFAVLGVQPALGRVFTEQEATIGNEQVVVLSDELWRTRFGSRSDIVGSDIALDGALHRVVGVMPQGFGFPDRDVDVWLPFAFTQGQISDQERGNDFSVTVGRMKPGATVEALNAELDTVAGRAAERVPGALAEFIEATGFTGRATPLREYIVGDVEQTLYLLQGIVLAVLLIACANISSLQLSRMIARRREIAIRASLGAARGRIARLVFVEMAMLVALGAAGAFALTYAGIELVQWLGLDSSSEGIEMVLDGRVALFNFAVALFAAVAAGLVPVSWILRSELAAGARSGGGSSGNDKAAHVFGNALVVVQIAVSFGLLVGAGLLMKSFYQMQSEGPGFASDGVLTARVTLPEAGYADGASQALFFERLLTELGALAGVTAAGYTSALPFGGHGLGAQIGVDGYEAPPGAPPPGASLNSISEGYFPSLEVAVLQGRNFAATETEPVAIVDEVFARIFWPDRDPIGQRVGPYRDGAVVWHTVVGVVPAIKDVSLAERPSAGTVYWHYRQQPVSDGFVTLRTALPPAALMRAAASTVAAIDPGLPLFDSMAMSARITESLGEQRAPMVLTIVFAGVALTLAIVGIYGVLAWAVTRRTGEIGVRMALGARSPDVLAMVLRQAGKLFVTGLVGGVLCALALGRFLSSQIQDANAADPVVFALAAVGLGAAAFAASWLPARRAARLDPMVALRSD